MDIYNYIRPYKDNSHIEVGDGLISVHTNEKSEVINCNNKKILDLSQDEYCINAKNGFFLICNIQSKKYYILNKKKERIVTISSYSLTILEHRNLIAYYDSEIYEVRIVDFAGKKLFSIDSEFASTFKSAHQISEYIICLEFMPNFEEDQYNKNGYYNSCYNKCIVLNISNNEIILEGKCVDGYDRYVVSEASYFEFPIMLPQKSNFGYTDSNVMQLIPVIKYTLVEPNVDDEYKVEYNRHVEFCDFYGNVVKRTEFSEISDQQNCFYIVEKDGHNNHDCTYGILDSLLHQFLPCCFPKLIIEDGIIKIEEPSWSDWISKELNIASKRFLAKRKNGESILLPYLYCSCDEKCINENDNIFFAYKYNEIGEFCKGIINTKGDEILSAIYKSIQRIHNNLYEAIIDCDELYKSQIIFIGDNEVILRNKYLKTESVDWCDYCRVRVVADDNSHIQVGIIDDKGLEVTRPIYDYVFYPREDKITFIKNGLAGWINLSDMSTHEYPRFSVIKPFVDGLSVVSVGEVKVRSLSKCTVEAGWFDEGNDRPAYTESEFDDIYGDICIRYTYVQHKEGIIDENGKIIVEPIYDEIIRIKGNQNYLIVKSKGEYGAINKDGDIIIPIQYSWYETDPYEDYDNYNGLSCVFGSYNDFNSLNGKVDFYNTNGELLGTEDMSSYRYRHQDGYDYDQNYDYERDTYYALGGDDYDKWREKGGNLDDMMDGMGF